MKIKNILTKSAILTLLPAAYVSAQTSPLSSIDYAILVLNDGVSDISDTSLSGDILLSNRSTNVLENISPLEGTVYAHSQVNSFQTKLPFAPTGGTITSGADSKINQANLDAFALDIYADEQTATASYGEINKVDFSYTSTSSLTVLDIDELIQDENTFSLNGRTGEDDQFIIRIATGLNFRKSSVILNNLDASDVLWYFGQGSSTDIFHASPAAEDYEFNGIVYNNSGQIRLGAEGSFNGAMIGNDIKIGSGAVFESVPEPSTSALILLGSMALLARRRRS